MRAPVTAFATALAIVAAMLSLGAAPPSLRGAADYGYVSRAIDSALASGSSQSWRGAGAYGSVTPLGRPVSGGSGESCAATACSDPCQSYIVIYETEAMKAKYRGYACREGRQWRSASAETGVEPVIYKAAGKPVDADADAVEAAQVKRARIALAKLLYVGEDASEEVAGEGYKAFLADEGADPDTPEEALVLLDAAVARAFNAGCPPEALPAQRPNRACVVIRTTG